MHKPAPAEIPLQLLLCLFIASLLVQPLVEPDFGWHLRAGIDLVKNDWHVPTNDPYSHSMAEWRWVDHAWLTDGVLALIYQKLGWLGPLGIIVFFAVLTGAAFWLMASTARAGRTSRFVSLSIVLWVALPFLGARTQMVSLLGLALFMQIWERYRRGNALVLWVLPGLFLLWANLHGGFTAGLFVLALLLVGSCLSRIVVARAPSFFRDEPVLTWNQIGQVAMVMCLAILVTLVNPYGWRLYQEIYDSLSDRYMIENLHEWQPVSLGSRAGRWYVAYLVLLALGTALFYRRREPLRGLVLIVFLLFSMRYLRNIPMFLLLSVPLCAELLEEAASKIAFAGRAPPESVRQWRFAAVLAASLGLVLLGPDHWQSVLRSGLVPVHYFRGTDYPMEAVEWINAHRGQIGTKLFNEYGNGGFLLWWLADTKIFIDGRMPAWRIGDRRIFYDYVALTARDPPLLEVLAKYGIDWAMVRTDSPLASALDATGRWDAPYRDRKVILYVKRSHAEAADEAMGRGL